MSGRSSGTSATRKRRHDRLELGVIGVGVMGGAMVRGILAAGVVAPDQTRVYDADEVRLAELVAATGARAAKANDEVVDGCQTVLLAVKPQAVTAVLEPLAALWREDHLLISIVAGLPIARLQGLTREGLATARVMPNVLCTVGAAASGVAFSERVKAASRAWVKSLLGSVGVAVEVEEKLMDAVTGLSGSGPAFVALVIEALADGGVAAGLPREQAVRLAAQTVMGTGKYLLETGEHPARLKDRVCSPAGTSIGGVRQLEAGGLRAALMEAVVRAARRSEELGQS